jgi:hypothetical protein
MASGMNWLPATRLYGMMNDGAKNLKVAADLLFCNMTHNSVPKTRSW